MDTCKVCGNESKLLFKTLVLKKYTTSYYQCINCQFIQTESPHWLNEAYESAITSLDIGIMYRNMCIYPILTSILRFFFNPKGKYVDYGGGYGILTRIMRDKGYDFYRYDTYCQNIFAKDFDKTNPESADQYELLTAFEVFEHLENPSAELEKMLKWSTNIFFSTELQQTKINSPDDWWYIIPETGQHIAFYTVKSLQLLGEKYGLNFYTNGVNLHMFTKLKISPLLFKLFAKYRIAKIIDMIPSKNKSLLMTDFESLKQEKA